MTVGTPEDPFFAHYFNGRDSIFCGGAASLFAGDTYAPCATVTFTDSVTGMVTPPNNYSTDAEYDACGNLVGGSTMPGWYTTNDPNGRLQSNSWVGGQSEYVPTGVSPACAGRWTVVYSFTQTFSDGQTLTANASATFKVTADQILEASETRGGGNPSEQSCQTCEADPVNTATGDYWESTTDLAIGGRGPGLQMSRTYSSLAAAGGQASVLGTGWSYGYGMSLAADSATGNATITEGNGSRTAFTLENGVFTAPRRVLATLVRNTDGTYAYKVRARTTYTFSGAGKLTRIADLSGNAVTLAYDASGQLLTATDGAARKLTFAYNATGRLATVTDSTGRKVTYAYDAGGNLASVTDPRSGVWTYDYDAAHLLLTRQDANRNTVMTNTYDSTGRALTQADALNRTTTFEYFGDPIVSTIVTDPTGTETELRYVNGMLTSKTFASGTSSAATWSFEYDLRGSLGITSVTNPNGYRSDFTYDTQGNQITSRTPLGHTTSSAYDPSNNLTLHTDENGVTSTFTYDTKGNLLTSSKPLAGTAQTQKITYTYGDRSHPDDITSVTDPKGKATTFTYTAAGDVASETDPAGNKTTYTYDALGRQLTEVSPRGNVKGATPASFTTTSTYDPVGNPLSVTDPLGHKQTTTYDAVGNVKSVTDPKGHITANTYDNAGQLTKTTRPDGSALLMGYDDDGNLAFETDAAGRTTTYTYDALNNLASMTDPLNRTSLYGRDRLGRIINSTDALGRLTNYGYNGDGQVNGASYSDAATHYVNYEYDPAGRRASMTDGSGTTSYTYDSLGRLAKVVDGHSAATSFGYDLNDNQTSITYPNGKTVTQAFDAANRMASITDWASAKTSFAYDADSNLTTTTFPLASKNVDSRTYNNAGELTNVKMAFGTATLANLAYTRDAEGQLTGETPTGLPGSAQTYAYDQLDRLSQAGAKSYAYDAADNPMTIAGTSGFAYDAANQLLSSPSASYTYDADGQRKTSTPSTGASTAYAYDEAGRLTSATTSGASTTFEYDGDGQRTAKTSGGTTTYYSWDESADLPTLLWDGSTSYIYGPDGRPIEQVSSSGATTYYHQDQLGSTRLLTNAAGAAVGTFTYDPHGNLAGSTGAVTTPLGYAGELRDPETGLIYLRGRYYDPRTGQFLSRDPLSRITGGIYGYADFDPLNRLDPTGLWSVLGVKIPSPSLQQVSDFAAGFGDAATFGGTNKVREALGVNDVVNFCSGSYRAGEVAGVGTSAAVGGAAAGGRLAAREAGAGVRAAQNAGKEIAKKGPGKLRRAYDKTKDWVYKKAVQHHQKKWDKTIPDRSGQKQWGEVWKLAKKVAKDVFDQLF